MPSAAFADVAQELRPSLVHYLRRLVGDHAIADDLTQETLLRMARAWPDFAARASVKTWAFSIATNAVADYFRNPEHRLKIVEIGEADDLADPGRSIEERMVVDEMNACVRQVIDSLPDTYRAALVLHDIENLSVEQTAGICGCSLANAKIRIHRARERLRKALQQQCTFYRDEDDVMRCDRKGAE